MSGSILVAYATRTGSTQEVAEAIATTLHESGFETEVRALREVDTLEGYRAVVIGAPLFMFHWHKDAFRFLARHRRALAHRPGAVFALGPLRDEENEWGEARVQLDKELAKCPWFKPVTVEIFGGKIDPGTLGLRWKLIPTLKNMPASDIRDWAAIRSWAIGLPRELQLVEE